MRRRVKGRKLATAFVSELVDVLAVPGNKFPSISLQSALSISPSQQPIIHPAPSPLPPPPPPSAPPTHVSSLQPHLPSRQPLFGVFLSRSRFRSGIQHYPKSVQKHNTYLSCVAFSSFYNNHLLLLSLQIFRYSPPRRLFNNPTKPSSPIYLHTLFFYHFPSPATRSFLSSLFSPVIVHKSRVQALFGSFI